MSPRDAFDRLTAPRGDGEVLVVPPAAEWPRLADANRRARRSWRLRLCGQAVGELASGHAGAGPVILTGHQPEFIHPGVWAKNVAAVAAAGQLGGEARLLIVDSDTPDSAGPLLPAVEGGRVAAPRVELPLRARELTYAQQPPHPETTWRAAWESAARAWPDSERCALDAFVGGFLAAEAALDGDASDYVRRWAAGTTAADRRTGLSPPAMYRVGRLSAAGVCPVAVPWGRFVEHMVEDAARLAAAYNEAIADDAARRGVGLRGARIPALQVSAERVELPLWAWRGTEPRRRVFASSTASGARRVFAGETEIGVLPGPGAVTADGEYCGWSIRPRALLLTLFVRMFQCDLFIHGLGGAKYDAITDEIIRRYFGVAPPAYACVTATLRLPLPRAPHAEQRRRQAARARRDAFWNPQRWATAAAGELVAARAAAVTESARLRREQPDQHRARRRVYDHLHELNERLRGEIADHWRRAEVEWAAAVRDAASDRVAASREWFYVLHPVENLVRLAGRVAASLGIG